MREVASFEQLYDIKSERKTDAGEVPEAWCLPAEACYSLRGLPGAVDAILENVQQRIFELPLSLASQANEVRALLKKYARVPMDLADACLVHLAGELGAGDILTLDSDFHVYRWNRTRPFRLLVDVRG